ncbi:hypothetical protein AB0N99_21190 [Streptomyces sp. NPDC093272]|uniref:DUF6907 domain-containing protein n=1 Tax=Streptomyces sp. NPDC093272 TaxID=3154981 RepID=UPI0034122BAA
MAINTAGRIASAQLESCPPWCVLDHRGDWVGDLFHRGADASASVPSDTAYAVGSSGAPHLNAHLVLPEMDEHPDAPPQITVDAGDLFGAYAELDVERADQFIRDLKMFTARVQQMRDQLAAMKEERS